MVNSQAELARLRTAVEELEAENDGLAGELETAKATLEDNHEELAKLQDEVDRREEADELKKGGEGEAEELQEKVEDLERVSLVFLSRRVSSIAPVPFLSFLRRLSEKAKG